LGSRGRRGGQHFFDVVLGLGKCHSIAYLLTAAIGPCRAVTFPDHFVTA
jgi:hypothetical protein